MAHATLSLAPHVGRFVSATWVSNGALLAVVLASGARGEHRVSVLDTRTWSLVTTFAIPGRAKSGVTPLEADGDTLFACDDHTLAAYDSRTGATRWARPFPRPASVKLLHVAKGKILALVYAESPLGSARLLRASDGAEESAVSETISPGLSAAALAPDGTLVIGSMRTIDVVRPGEPTRRIPYEQKRWGVVDTLAVDEASARVVLGTRAGEVLLTDLGTGVTASLLEMEECIRSVGFHRGAPWALDGGGRFRLLADGAPLSVDLGIATYGGIIAEDGATIALSDYEARTFRVRALPSNEERFATTPGFSCDTVGIDAEGAVLVSSSEKLVRIDPASGEVRRVGGEVDEIARLENGDLVLFGASARFLARGADKTVTLARSFEDASVAGGLLFAMTGEVGEIWDLVSGKRTWRIDLAKTWIADHGHALRLVHLGPDGRPWIHLSNGQVWRADALDGEGGYVATLSKEGVLWVHPRGDALYWARERTITRLAIDGFEEGPPLPLAVDAEVSKLVFSPSGDRLAVFHRNGRLSTVDLAAERAAAVDTPETSAAEREPNELFVVDLRTPHGCAFSRDEAVVAWTHAGGVTFADVHTGAVVGRLVLSTSGRDYVVTDGARFDWPGAKRKRSISSEIVATEAGRRIDDAGLLARREAGLLARLTR